MSSNGENWDEYREQEKISGRIGPPNRLAKRAGVPVRQYSCSGKSRGRETTGALGFNLDL